MATGLKEFLSNLATDPRKLGEFLHEPEAAMSAANLSEADKTALKSGVAGMIAARLAGVPLDQAFTLLAYQKAPPAPVPMIEFLYVKHAPEPPPMVHYVQMTPEPTYQKVALQFPYPPPQHVVYPPQFVVQPPPQYVVYPPQFVVQPPPQYVVYPPQFVVQPPPQFVVYPPYYPR